MTSAPPLSNSFSTPNSQLNRFAIATKGATMMVFLLSDPRTTQRESDLLKSPHQQCQVFQQGGPSKVTPQRQSNSQGAFDCFVLAVAQNGLLVPVPRSAVSPSGEINMAQAQQTASAAKKSSSESASPPRSSPTTGTLPPPPIIPAKLPGQTDPQLRNVSSLKHASSHYGPFDRYEEYPALFGALLLDKLYLLIATKTEVAFFLPNADTLKAMNNLESSSGFPIPKEIPPSSMSPVFNITGSKWITVALPALPQIKYKKKDKAHYKTLLEFNLEQGYYYCNDLDLATPFPHRPLDMRALAVVGSSPTPTVGCPGVSVTSHSTLGTRAAFKEQKGRKFPQGTMEADWGSYLRKPFLEFSYGGCCAVLHRGFAGGNALPVEFVSKPSLAPNPTHLFSSPVSSRHPAETTDSPKAFGKEHRSESTTSSVAPEKQQASSFGVVGDSDFPGADGSQCRPGALRVHLLGRQSKVNPGPRYYGRGMNDLGGAGNDHVYELVMWQMCRASDVANEGQQVLDTSPKINDDSPPQTRSGTRVKISGDHFVIRYTRHTFLRGTVPVHWINDIKKTSVGEVQMIFGNREDVHKRSGVYLDTILHKLCATLAFDTESWESEDTSLNPELAVSLRCLNLLRAFTQSGEHHLSQHFEETIKKYWDEQICRLQNHEQFLQVLKDEQAEKSDLLRQETSDRAGGIAAGETTKRFNRLDICHLDWLNSVKELGLDGAVRKIWEHIIPFYVASEESTCSHCTVSSSHLDVTQRQSHFYRVNCADSLDRTNLGCFFSVLQVSLDMLLCHGASVISSGQTGGQENTSFGNHGQHSKQSEGEDSLLHEDSRGDNAFLSTGPPSNSPSTAHLDQKKQTRFPYYADFGKMKVEFPPPLLKLLGELFVANGDCVAQLYTSSGALHTNAIRNLVPGMKGAPSNAFLSVKRRFENIFEDKKKFRCLETLLGQRIPLHFPHLQSPYLAYRLTNRHWPHALVLDGITLPVAAEDRVDLHGLVDLAVRKAWGQIVNRNQSQGGSLLPPPEVLKFNVHLARGVTLSHLHHQTTVHSTSEGSEEVPSPLAPKNSFEKVDTAVTPPRSDRSSTTPTAEVPLAEAFENPQTSDPNRQRVAMSIIDPRTVTSSSTTTPPPAHVDPALGEEEEEFEEVDDDDAFIELPPPNDIQYVAVVLFDAETNNDWGVVQKILEHCCSNTATSAAQSQMIRELSAASALSRACGVDFSISNFPCGRITLLIPPAALVAYSDDPKDRIPIPGSDPEVEVNVRPYFYRVQPSLSTQESVEKKMKSAQKNLVRFGQSIKSGFMNAVGKKK